jgi:hypothetical protein
MPVYLRRAGLLLSLIWVKPSEGCAGDGVTTAPETTKMART